MIVWLLVALLPLRGWAFATMHPPKVEAPPPCHAAAPEDAAPDSPAAACALCDVCHGAMLAFPMLPAAAQAPKARTFAAAAAASPPAGDAEAPFRPPRR